jgi:hypothetical protein
MVAAVKPGGLVLDLQVIRPDPVIESGEERICEIWGQPIFATADAATAAIDATIGKGLLTQEAVDDHQVRTHFPTGPDLIKDFAGKRRRIPEQALPKLLANTGPVTMREHCRLRRLRVVRAGGGQSLAWASVLSHDAAGRSANPANGAAKRRSPPYRRSVMARKSVRVWSTAITPQPRSGLRRGVRRNAANGDGVVDGRQLANG